MTTPRKSLAPWINDDIEYYDYQINGIRQMARMTNVLLADEMGLGKSVQAITSFGIDVARGWGSQCIVICPATLRGNWSDELEKWTGFPFVILGLVPTGDPRNPYKKATRENRLKQLQEFANLPAPKVLITNYEMVVAHIKDLNQFKWDMAIYDEAQYIKGYNSKRTKACHQLRASRALLLSGSPMLNMVNDLWGLLYKVAPGEFPNYWRFVNRFCMFGGFNGKQIVGVKNEKELRERLQHYMIRRTSKEVLKNPEPYYVKIPIDLLPQQRELYDSVYEDLLLETADGIESIDNALTKYLRLKQVCGTTAAFGLEDHSAKLDKTIEMIEELTANGYKVIVFTQFRAVLAALGERMRNVPAPYYEIHGDIEAGKRVPIIHQWESEPGAAVIGCMLQVVRYGLNMGAARHIIFIDKDWAPEQNKQAVGRCGGLRNKSGMAVQVFELIARNTIESRIEQILRVKTALFTGMIETPNFKKRLMEELRKAA